MKDIDHQYPDLDEVCVRCGEHFGELPDDDLTEAICPSCYNDMEECKGCGHRFDELDENELCESCAEEKAETQIIYAVDFDGTLCEVAYPGIGKPIAFMIRFCKERKAEGNKLILWTCRNGSLLDEAVAWCKEQGIEFDAVNENLPNMIEQYGGDTRKVSANYYIDDKLLSMAEINIRQTLTDAGMIPGNDELSRVVVEMLMVEALK